MFDFRKSVATFMAAASVARPAGRGAGRGADPQGRHAFGPEDPRSDLDHRLHPAQLTATWSGTRCSRWTRSSRSSRRWSTSTTSRPTSSPGPSRLRDGLEWQRRQAGHRGGLHRLDQALGRQRFDGPEDDGLGRRLRGGRRQDLQDEDEGALRPGAAVARQAVVERALHDAEASRPRPIPCTQIKAEDVIGSGPVHLRAPTNGSRARRSVYVKNPKYKPRAEPRLGPGRRQGRQGRPRRMDLDLRRADPGRGAAERRDRHDRDRPATTCCRCWPRTRTSSCSTAIRSATSTPSASTALLKPFDNPKIRHAVMVAFNQEDFLKATIGDPKYYKLCKAVVRLRHAAGQRRRHGRRAERATPPRPSSC